MLSCQRHLFSLPESIHYLNCAYMGPLPKATEAAGLAGVQSKSDPTGILTEDFFAPVEELRGLVGRLVNASTESVAMIPAVSYGVATNSRSKLASELSGERWCSSTAITLTPSTSKPGSGAGVAVMNESPSPVATARVV